MHTIFQMYSILQATEYKTKLKEYKTKFKKKRHACLSSSCLLSLKFHFRISESELGNGYLK